MLHVELNDILDFHFWNVWEFLEKLDEEHSSCSSWCMHISSFPGDLPAERIGSCVFSCETREVSCRMHRLVTNLPAECMCYLRSFLRIPKAMQRSTLGLVTKTTSFWLGAKTKFEKAPSSILRVSIYSNMLHIFLISLLCHIHASHDFFIFSSSSKIHI